MSILLSLISLVFFLNYQSSAQPQSPPPSLQNYPVYTQIQKALRNPQAVYRLDLSNQKLKSIPSEVFLFSNLQELNLSQNRLTELPQEIEKLKRLKYLNLYNNKIKKLPPQIVELKKLEVLLLGKNQLEQFPSLIRGLKNLTYLDISQNNFSTYEIDYIRERLPACVVRF